MAKLDSIGSTSTVQQVTRVIILNQHIYLPLRDREEELHQSEAKFCKRVAFRSPGSCICLCELALPRIALEKYLSWNFNRQPVDSEVRLRSLQIAKPQRSHAMPCCHQDVLPRQRLGASPWFLALPSSLGGCLCSNISQSFYPSTSPFFIRLSITLWNTSLFLVKNTWRPHGTAEPLQFQFLHVCGHQPGSHWKFECASSAGLRTNLRCKCFEVHVIFNIFYISIY